jgi:hypothetical protein
MHTLFVLVEVSLLCEIFRTDRANIRPIACVNSQMINNVAFLLKAPKASWIAAIYLLVGPFSLFVLHDLDLVRSEIANLLGYHSFARPM